MRFEWDERKSEANEAKHGISFDEARALWEDPYGVDFRVAHEGERRYGTIARSAAPCGSPCGAAGVTPRASSPSAGLRKGRLTFMTARTLTAEDVDRMVDDGEDMTDYIRMDTIAQPGLREAEAADQPRQVNATIPAWLVQWLDGEAARRGVARKAVINTALVEWADEQRERAARLAATA